MTKSNVPMFLAVFLGLVIFVSVIWVGFSIEGPPRCEDGWRSSSIGKQGACSYHGGVQEGNGILIFMVSSFAGFCAWGFSYGAIDSWINRKPKS